MLARPLLVTNNPALFASQRNGLDVSPVFGTAHEVMCLARDRVHLGWRLLNHPLYGNYRPYQQPFRSLLVAPGQRQKPDVDPESLHLLEQAFAVYDSCADRWATPDNVPPEMLADCSVIDMELMRETLTTIP